MKTTWKYATSDDSVRLADWNHRLISEEGHRNQMTPDELRRRMEGFLQGEYRAVICSVDDEEAAYVLYRTDPAMIYIRQLYVLKQFRRRGVGRSFVAALRKEVWPKGLRVAVEVLVANPSGVSFWRAIGFSDYSITLEVMPDVKLG